MKHVARRALIGFPVARKPFSAAVFNAAMLPEEHKPSSSKKNMTYNELPLGKSSINYLKIFTNRHDFNVEILKNHAKHGDTYKSSFFGTPSITTRDPNLVKALVSPHEANADRVDMSRFLPGIRIMGDIFGKINEENKDLELFSTAVGQKNWAVPRRIAEQGLQKMSFVKKSNETAHIVAERLMKRWQKQCTAALRKQPAGYSKMPRGFIRCDTVEEDLQRFALDIMGYLAFDKDFGRLSEEEGDTKDLGRTIVHGYNTMVKQFLSPKFLLSPVKWWEHVGQFSKDFKDLQKACLDLGQVVAKLIEERIEERKANGGAVENNCYLDMLIDNSDSKKMTSEWLMLQGFTIIIVGADTTVNTSTFMAHELARNPYWQDRVYEAIAPVFAANPRPSYSELAEIPELNAFIKETQRMYPITPQINREIPEGFTYDGVTYPKMMCNVSMIGLHRNPEQFEEPERFNPQRFMDKQRGADNPWSFQPFGGGKRGCPGMRVALMDLRVILAQMVYNFEFMVSSGYAGDMKDCGGLNKLRPNLEVVMGPRSKFNRMLWTSVDKPSNSFFSGLKAIVSPAAQAAPAASFNAGTSSPPASNENDSSGTPSNGGSRCPFGFSS